MRWIFSFVFLALLAVAAWIVSPPNEDAGYRAGAALGYPLIPWLIGTITLFVRTRKRPATFVDYAIAFTIALALIGLAQVGKVIGAGS